MSRTRQSKSQAVRTNPTPGEHYDQAMEYAQTPLGVQLPRRRDDPHFYSNLHKDFLQDHSKPGLSSSQSSSASTRPSQFHLSPPASFANLQTDLLIMIFKFFLAPINVSYFGEIAKRRTTLLLLNSAFNNLVNSTPSLWSHIPISGPITNYTRAQRSLDRAGGVGLWWAFDLRNDDSSPDWATKEVVSSLLDRYLTPQTMEQTTHLHIILNTFSLFSTVFRHLRFPSPALQEFKIVRGDMVDMPPLDMRYFQGLAPPTFKIEDGVFGGHTPALRFVQMHRTPKPRTFSLIKNITGGGGARPCIQYLDLSQQQEMHPDVFYNLLEGISTSLKTLVLRGAGPEIWSEELDLDRISPWLQSGKQILKSKRGPYVVTLPCLCSLVIGGMTANYLASLLSTLHFQPLTSLGVHGIGPAECEKIWDVLSRQPALLSVPAQRQPIDHSNRAFGSIGTLELFDLLPSPEMRVAYPKPVEGEPRKSPGSKGNGFHGFLVVQESLNHMMMRKVGIEFVKAVADMSQPENETFNISSLIPAPPLEILEACCIVDVYLEDLIVPEALEDVGAALVDVLHARLDCAHRIGRLHLDGDEWAMHKGTRDKFIDDLAQLGEGAGAPIVHWDARAPFFADYYDSDEI